MSKTIEESSNPQSNLRGTISYIDPKKLNDSQPYSLNEKSDVYSVGVLLWEISSGQPPFKESSRYYLMTNYKFLVNLYYDYEDNQGDAAVLVHPNLFPYLPPEK